MSGSFDWQNEEDSRRAQDNWDEPQPAPERPRRLPWRLLLILGVLALAAGGIIWWRVDQRIAATMRAVRTDVIASHNLLQQAAADGDAELFRAFLSGRDPAWTAGQIEVLDAQMFSQREAFGLQPAVGSVPAVLPAALADESVAGEVPAAIELSPDLSEAVVTLDQPFVTEDGRTIALAQTAIYRRGDARWLLAPPLAEFWGRWESASGPYLTLIFPQRDSDIGQQLVADLNDDIARACQTLPGLSCSPDLRLSVRLDDDPATLAALSSPLGALERAHEAEDILELPAPTLVGRPAGDTAEARNAAYQALRHGYAKQVLAAVIAQETSWQCCHARPLFAALYDYQLSQLGQAAWPVGAADYQRVLDERLALYSLNELLSEIAPAVYTFNAADNQVTLEGTLDATDDDSWAARVVVDFLMTEGGVDSVEAQRQLPQARNLSRYVGRLLTEGGRPPSADVNQALWLYAIQRAAEADAEPLLPEDSLFLVCTAPGESEAPETSRLVAYRPQTEAWANVYSRPGFIWMTPLPGGTSLLLQEFGPSDGAWETRLWQADGIQTVYAADSALSAISLGQTNHDGTRLLAYTFDETSDATQGIALDLTDCAGDACAAEALPGILSWSPDGAHALVYGEGDIFPGTLMVINGRYVLLDTSQPGPADSLALQAEGSSDMTSLSDAREAYAPFWLDARTYGYIRRQGEERGQLARANDDIVLATIDDPTPQPLLLAADLFQFLPEPTRRTRPALSYVAPNPADPDELFIVVVDDVLEEAFVFRYDRATGLPELRLRLGAEFNHSLGFSPDGRYLVLTGTGYLSDNPTSNLAPLLLHDIAANRTIPLLTRLPYFLPSVVYDWTSDGLLALALDDNLVGVIDPDTGGVRQLSHAYGACTSVAWLAR